ncbi:lipid IV(A) 3-deoxy-D-manno-octulosonic acid transferase [Marinobacterium sediminicola]|uniref:3-deoxy-D-manno-octulosonic acid transferase n=1 Tax=Marinobacterium sediminicola TaxID=518898 RepID=A0ABY1RZ93_9GAMM|nr:lipid IV(A) 3-deoxy-D-manno-octulosonic acid transferase [Marinobacterium sediminicola]ULG69091.1 lipid IV(A) 3-deoxy-D-manno-octulosonic acid transferase [Marinobacterium sediminicola]SMR73632.1 3-deoxy-D-manno-octulosonic-acid transferase [Marinobacterium sediminicola]
MVARYLYTLLFYLLAPLLLLRLWWRGRKAPGYRRNWTQRLGLGPVMHERVIWVHAVSVGETVAIAPLVRWLLERYPQHRVLMTSMTPTGSEQVKALFSDRVEQRFCPWDLPLALRAFLRRTRPELCIIVETELWPNLVAQCSRAGVPVMLANARLSARSARGYRKFAALTRPMLRRLSLIAAQNPADAERFIALDMPAERVVVTGSIKFDLQPDCDKVRAGQELRRQLGNERPVLIAASTHQGEDEVLLEAWRQLKANYPELVLILVPRHPERFANVAQLCRRYTDQLVCRSRGESPGLQTEIYLGDTMGELVLLYAAADIAFVGGSFSGTGGHNPLEPAALGVPVVMGPDCFNFQVITDALIEAGGLVRVDDTDGLMTQLSVWLDDADERRDAGRQGMDFVEGNRGALLRLQQAVERLLP